ncbi:50S ribosomal protein L18 [Candidatus Micrarchaeota archaeon]|nr:50S ribosomal protein L18 [Candidatus Micrarchaeota archaeon]
MKATGPLYAVHFKRRREVKTDYSKRLALLKSGKPRLIVRKTNKYIITQFALFNEKGDAVSITTSSKELSKYGFDGKTNTPSGYLTGFLTGKKALNAGVKEFVLDVGLNPITKGNVLFAVLKGAIDAGLKANYSEDVLPSEDRMSGKHLKIEAKFAEAKKKIEQLK